MRRAALGVVASATVLLAGCGGGQEVATPAPGSPENPLIAAQPGETPAGTSARVPSGEPSSQGAGKPGYTALVERQTSRPKSESSPCNLVPRSEAERIVGERLQAPVEGPQGPTCIYQPRSGKRLITLAVQDIDFRTIKPQVRRLRSVNVSGQTAYCGSYGQAMLYLPLKGGRLLSVSGSCKTARVFAAAALKRL